jgi:colicin import membrane protein
LGEINKKMIALAKEKEETMLKGVALGVHLQAAVDAEARLQHEWKRQQEAEVRIEAELETARQAERAERELKEAEERLQKARQALEEKRLKVGKAWQRGERLQRESERRDSERREREWREQCDREDAEAERERQKQAAEEREVQKAMEREYMAKMAKEFSICTPQERDRRIATLKEEIAHIISSKGFTEAQLEEGKLEGSISKGGIGEPLR